jgi:hypothetical protein
LHRRIRSTHFIALNQVYTESGKDIKSAWVRFEDATGDGEFHRFPCQSPISSPILLEKYQGIADYTKGDYLYFYDTSTLKGVYSVGSGLLRIKGRDSPQAYQDALREIGYRGEWLHLLAVRGLGSSG